MTEEEHKGGNPQPEPPERIRLRDHVSRHIERLQGGYTAGSSAAVSTLAKLRNGVGKPVGAELSLLQYTTAGLYPEGTPLPDEPTDRERAAYTAITLFAVHQQSQRELRMHQAGDGTTPGNSLGKAAGRLYQKTGAPGVIRRFEGLGTAQSWPEINQHARGLIQLLRAEKIPLDYGRFAEDLLALQRPEWAATVRNRWGRDFYRLTQRAALDSEAQRAGDVAGAELAGDPTGSDSPAA